MENPSSLPKLHSQIVFQNFDITLGMIDLRQLKFIALGDFCNIRGIFVYISLKTDFYLMFFGGKVVNSSDFPNGAEIFLNFLI